MLMIISPAKTLDESPMQRHVEASQPRFIEEASQLVDVLKALSPDDIASLMHISDKLATLNYGRYQAFTKELDEHNAKPALFSFQGDVYKPLELATYSSDTLAFANRHLRILSGMYGVLRPLDYLYPYRLEMGTKLNNIHGNTLYDFWGDKVTDVLNEDMKEAGTDIILNVASTEYNKVVQPHRLEGRYITVDFKERKGNVYKIVGIHAKKARGMMVDYILKNQLTAVNDVKAFDYVGYGFSSELSSDDHFIFTRD